MRDLVLCYVKLVKKDELVYDWIIEEAIAVVGNKHFPALDNAIPVAPSVPSEESNVVWQTSDGGIQYRFEEDVLLVTVESTNPDGPLGCQLEGLSAEYLFEKDWVNLALIGKKKIQDVHAKRVTQAILGNNGPLEEHDEIRFWALYRVVYYSTNGGDSDFKKELIGSVNMDCDALKDAVEYSAT